MTKKDYILIADAIIAANAETGVNSQAELRGANKMLLNVMASLTRALASDNPRFQSRRFQDYIRQGNIELERECL